MSESEKKKRGRPPLLRVAMTSAQRKREQRSRMSEKVMESDELLNDAECLFVLGCARWPAGGAIDRDAWRQLGRNRGYL